MIIRSSSILAVFVGLAGGCPEPTSRCQQSVLPDCDVAQAECQQALHAHVACVRGADPDGAPPEFEFIEVGDYASRYGALPGPDEDMGHCLHLASFMPFDPAVDGVDATAIFDPELRRVVVADRSDTTAVLRAIAQAQRDGELGGYLAWRSEHGATLDQATALDVLFAGEAQLVADVAALRTVVRDDEDLRRLVKDTLDDYEDGVRDFLSYARSRRYQYPFVNVHTRGVGAKFALKTFLAQNPGELEDAYARPVRSTAELMRGRLTDTLPGEPATHYQLPPGYGLRAPDRLGASLYYAFLARVDPVPLPGDQPWDPKEDLESRRYEAVAGRWQGDRLDCALDGSGGNALVVWDLVFDPTVALDPFTITYNTPGEWQWVERENSLTLVGGSDPEAVDLVVQSLQ